MRFAAISRNSTRRTSAVSTCRALAAALVVAAVPAPVPAQAPVPVAGTILRPIPGDTVPVGGVRVVLHRVGPNRQGPVDSVRTGRDGAFRLTAVPDTAVLFLVSARHGGVEFFAEPLRLVPGGTIAPIRLMVADTSSTASIVLASRYIVVGAPDSARERPVIDLLVLRNPGLTTRVSPDSSIPTWKAALPAGATHRVPEVGSDISPLAARFEGDSVFVFAPIPPGEKQLLVEHRWPAEQGELEFPLGPDASDLQVVAEEQGATVTGGTVAKAAPQVVDGRPLERWTGRIPARGVLAISLPSRQRAEPRLILIMVTGFALFLVAAGVLLVRRSGLARAGGRP